MVCTLLKTNLGQGKRRKILKSKQSSSFPLNTPTNSHDKFELLTNMGLTLFKINLGQGERRKIL